jgi:two-component sensor histidine kinase
MRLEPTVSSTPMRDAAGEVVGAIAVVQDIEERKKAEKTNVQAIARLMLQRSKDLHEFAGNFSGRIQSLSRVHAMLSATTWAGVDLLDLVRDQLLAGDVDAQRS